MGDPARYLDLQPVFKDGKPVPPLTPNPDANRLLGRDPNAFLVGLILDQRIPAERAFAGPYELQQRLGHFDVKKIAAMPVEEFVAVFARKPALHRFPNAMGPRVHAACALIASEYGGKADKIWKAAPDAATAMKALGTVPGIGPAKQHLAMLLLGRYYGLDLPGWREASPVPLPR